MEEVLEADGAVVVHGAGDALVVTAQLHGVAAPAREAVEEVVAPADAAYPAAVAVEHALGHVVVEEAAMRAKVRAEDVAAALAAALNALLEAAVGALDRCHGETVQLVRLFRVSSVHGFVVAVSAPEELLAAGRSYSTTAAIVAATSLNRAHRTIELLGKIRIHWKSLLIYASI